MSDRSAAIAAFWSRARSVAGIDATEPEPPAWAFGATAEHADSLLTLVLDGTKTGTAETLWNYQAEAEPVPTAGDYSIILDGAGTPRALIVTESVATVPFDEVTAEHAWSEGEGDRTLAGWRHIHERFWCEHSADPRGFHPQMPVVCERFRLLYDERAADSEKCPLPSRNPDPIVK